MTDITDEDRARYLELNALPPADAAAVRAGQWDNTTGMQILAAHRLAAEARGAERERARVVGLEAALAKIMPIRVHDGQDYAEVYFADGQTHSTQAMTMNPQDWLDIAAALSRHADQGDNA